MSVICVEHRILLLIGQEKIAKATVSQSVQAGANSHCNGLSSVMSLERNVHACVLGETGCACAEGYQERLR